MSTIQLDLLSIGVLHMFGTRCTALRLLVHQAEDCDMCKVGQVPGAHPEGLYAQLDKAVQISGADL
jgi:hypothetical protein